MISLHLKLPASLQKSLVFAEIREKNGFPFELTPAWLLTATTGPGTEELAAFLEKQIVFLLHDLLNFLLLQA